MKMQDMRFATREHRVAVRAYIIESCEKKKVEFTLARVENGPNELELWKFTVFGKTNYLVFYLTENKPPEIIPSSMFEVNIL